MRDLEYEVTRVRKDLAECRYPTAEVGDSDPYTAMQTLFERIADLEMRLALARKDKA